MFREVSSTWNFSEIKCFLGRNNLRNENNDGVEHFFSITAGHKGSGMIWFYILTDTTFALNRLSTNRLNLLIEVATDLIRTCSAFLLTRGLPRWWLIECNGKKVWKVLTVLYGDQIFPDVGQIETGDDFNSCSDKMLPLVKKNLPKQVLWS